MAYLKKWQVNCFFWLSIISDKEFKWLYGQGVRRNQHYTRCRFQLLYGSDQDDHRDHQGSQAHGSQGREASVPNR